MIKLFLMSAQPVQVAFNQQPIEDLWFYKHLHFLSKFPAATDGLLWFLQAARALPGLSMYKQGQGWEIKPQIKPREYGAAMFRRWTGLPLRSVCISPHLSASLNSLRHLFSLIAPISFTCNPARIPWRNNQDQLYLKYTLFCGGGFFFFFFKWSSSQSLWSVWKGTGATLLQGAD